MNPEILILLNTVVRFLLEANLSFDDVAPLVRKAQAEGRDVTQDELNAVRDSVHAARDRSHAAVDAATDA